MKTEKLTAIMMAILITMMPMVYADTSTFNLFASVPTATKDNSITITGTTKPNIDVVVSVNKARVAEIISESNGDFSTSPITLVREDNDITIRATDGQGNVRTLTYNVKIDNTPPNITYTDIPTGSQTRTINIKGTTNEPITIDWKTSNLTIYKTVQVQDTFNFNIDLEDGLNKLELIAKDSAGNKDKQEYEITYDIVAPSFLSNNLNALDNCYLDFPAIAGKKVDIKGQVNEKATLFVYVNHETNPSKVRTTDENGYFRIKDVHLKGKIQTETSPTQITLGAGTQYEYHIRVVAKDLAGNEETIEKTITCQTCGGGASGYTLSTASALQVITPTSLLPKLLINGIETITMPFNLSYTGLNDAAIRNIRVTPVIMGAEYADKYDNDKINVNVISQYSRDKQTATGIIQIKINKFDPLGAVEPDATQSRREYNVSQHRYAQCAFQPGLGRDLNYGCMRFFLMMEVQYQETTDLSYLDPNVRQTIGPTRENKIQKICISNIEIEISKITDEYIPKKMIRKQIKNIDHILKKIAPVQEYLETATVYATYTCIGSAATLALSKLAELTSCKIGDWISTAGGARWHSEIAEAGMCYLVYHKDFDKKDKDSPGIKGNQGARNACKTCSGVIGLRKWLEYEVMHRACDRVGCPAAKTFKSYIRNQGPARDITTYITDHFDKAPKEKASAVTAAKKEISEKHGIDKQFKIYTGSDCGFTTNPKLISTTYEDVGSAKGIKTLYTYTKDQEKRKYCTKYLRASNPYCCGIEYDREWGTACGIGRTFGVNIGVELAGIPIGLDTFDELAESTCYAARQAGQPKATGTGLDCSGGLLWNAAAGFCEPNTGKAVDEVIYTGMNYKPLKPDADKNRVLVFVKPIMKTKKEVEDYAIYRGYAIQKLKYEANKKNHPRATRLTQALYEIYDSEDLSGIFKDESKSDKAKKAELKNKLCKDSGKIIVDKCDNIDRTYNRIKEIIGSGDEDKEYIVRADSNLLRSIQCICFPAVNAWVDQWVQILTMLRNCLATVEIGKGDAGVCDEFISQVICDRIYELLKCFSSKVGWSGAGTRITADFGIGSIIGILTNTASEMSNTMQARYGKTSMWVSLFNEKQLVHGVCMWAFGAKFDLQIEQIAQHMTEEIAIESQPIITECKRYFRGYSPTTNPSGLTTWAYDCGMAMVAGANVHYQIKLQCSDDYRCAEKDGFRNNECDCIESGKKEITVERGTMNQGDMFNKKFLWTIQAGHSRSKLRYDTAILYYEWIDPKTQEKRSNQATRYIYQSGAEPFGFCAFDPFTAAFRCQFGKQEGGINIKKINVDYKGSKHPKKDTAVFFMDQSFTFEAQVKQSIPDDPSKQLESKKFLYYRIENHAGQKVKETKPDDSMNNVAAHVFESSGDYYEEISISLPKTEIQKYLKVVPGKIPMGQKEIDGAKEVIDPIDYISSYDISKGTNENLSIIVEMTLDKIEIYHAGSVSTRSFNKGTLIHSQDEYSPGLLEIEGTYTIKLDIDKKPEYEEIIRIYIPAKKTSTPSPWDSGDPADWKIIFTLYDANKYGESTDQITYSPDGQKQVKEVRFKVVGLTKTEGGEISEPKITPLTKSFISEDGIIWIAVVNQPNGTRETIRGLTIKDIEDQFGITEAELFSQRRKPEPTIKPYCTETDECMKNEDCAKKGPNYLCATSPFTFNPDGTIIPMCTCYLPVLPATTPSLPPEPTITPPLVRTETEEEPPTPSTPLKVETTPKDRDITGLVVPFTTKISGGTGPYTCKWSGLFIPDTTECNPTFTFTKEDAKEHFAYGPILIELFVEDSKGQKAHIPILIQPTVISAPLGNLDYTLQINDYIISTSNKVFQINSLTPTSITAKSLTNQNNVNIPVTDLLNYVKIVPQETWLLKGDQYVPIGFYTKPAGDLVKISKFPEQTSQGTLIQIEFLAQDMLGTLGVIPVTLLNVSAKLDELKTSGGAH